MSVYDAVIIGAGPAGIMAAITAARADRRVALLDRNQQIGRKLLVTGSGRCNLTNRLVSSSRYHGAPPEFVEGVISRFDQFATMSFFESLGLVLKEEDNGRIFPRTNQAASVVEVLGRELLRLGVDVMLETLVARIVPNADWTVRLSDARAILARRLIVATGGRAAHHLGSTGDGLYWADILGHHLTDIHQALVPIESEDSWPAEVQGTKVEARVTATCDGEELGRSEGDLLFTAYGVSGPAPMALAGAIAPHLRAGQVILHVDVLPEMTEHQIGEVLTRIRDASQSTLVKDALMGIVPSSLIPVILRFAELSDELPLAGLSDEQRAHLIRTMKDLPITVSQLRRLREAQVTAGGIDARDVDPQTLESRITPRLYFAGEILDVHGDSGGFNLQWAWSSGYVAGSFPDQPEES